MSREVDSTSAQTSLWRSIVGVVLMVVGVSGILGGATAGSRGMHLGWPSAGAGVAVVVLSYRVLRAPVDPRSGAISSASSSGRAASSGSGRPTTSRRTTT